MPSSTTMSARVFERLAVFTDFDAPGARAVVADAELDAWSVLDAIAGLVRKSMLVADEQADGTTRYQMLETLRQYALEVLGAHDDVDAWRRRHATYFAQFAEEIGPALLGPDEFAARVRLYADVDNLRTACMWALDRDDGADEELGVRILAALAEDYAMTSLTGLALPSATRALDAARRSTPGRRAAVLASAAYEAQARFDVETARKLGQEALAGGITPDCPTPYRVYFAAVSDGQSALPEMIPLLEEAIEELAAMGAHTAEQARVCGMLVQASVRAGDFEGAHRYAERALELAEQSGNPSTLAQLLYYIGTSWARDDPDRALSAYAQSIALCREGANYATLGAALFQGALLLARKGERTRALTDLRESIVFQSRSEMRPQLEGALAYAMEIFTVLGEFEEAAVIAGAARGGALTHLRGMATPADRRQRGSGPMRDALGPERFSECAAAGAAMSIEELVSWALAALDRLRS